MHQPPLSATEGQGVAIEATVTDPVSPVVEVLMYYRPAGTLGFVSQPLVSQGLVYVGRIPGSGVRVPGIEYYLEARNRQGMVGTWPAFTPSVTPQLVPVRPVAVGPNLKLLSPAAGSSLTAENLVFVVAIDARTSRTDVFSLKVFFDELDVTRQAQLSETLISYVPPEDVAPGLHALRVVVRNLQGDETQSPTWAVTIQRPGGAPPSPIAGAPTGARPVPAFQFSGGMTAESQYAWVNPKPSPPPINLAQPEGWLNRISLDFAGQQGETGIAGSAYLTSEDRPGLQPVDRVRLDIYQPDWKLSLGDSYPVFSDLSLSSPFLRGINLSLTAGNPLQAEAAGSLLQVVGGLSLYPFDGRPGEMSGTFARYLYGARWLYDFFPGTGLALNLSSLDDDPGSIGQPAGSFPIYNHVVTAEAHFKFPLTSRVSLTAYGEAGESYYDEQGVITTIAVGSSWRGGVRCEWEDRSQVRLEYRSAGADYVARANPWLITDWQGVLGDGRLVFWDDRLTLAVAGESWHDNLRGQKSFTYVDAAGITVTAGTTQTQSLNTNLNCQLPWVLSSLSLGLTLVRQLDDARPVPIIDHGSQVYQVAAGFQVPLAQHQWVGSLSLMRNLYRDNAATKLSGNLDGTTGALGMTLLWDRDWTFSGNLSRTDNLTDASGVTLTALAPWQNLRITTAGLRANWKTLPGSLDLGVGLDSLLNQDDLGLVNSQLITLSLQGITYWADTQSLTLTLSRLGYADQVTASKTYAEWVANLRYAYRF